MDGWMRDESIILGVLGEKKEKEKKKRRRGGMILVCESGK